MAYLDSSNVQDLVSDIKALADQTYATPSDIPDAATATPLANAGDGAVGSSTKYAKEDHKHPIGTNASRGSGYGTCSTEASIVAKVATVGSYKLIRNGLVSIYFTYDVPAEATLNIDSQGAKAIYYKTSGGTIGQIEAGVIKGGDIATMIYLDAFYLVLSIDRNNVHFDTTPTQNSSNLITSGGVYTALSAYNNVATLAYEVVT